MLIAYWDIRNLRDNIDLVADLLRREEPDLCILQNIGNFDHTWTDQFTDYDDQRLFNSNTEPRNPSTTDQTYARRFHGGILLLAKNNVLQPEPSSATDPTIKLVSVLTTDFFDLLALNLPSYGYTQARHDLRRAAEAAHLPAIDHRFDLGRLVLGSFAITPSDLDIHPALKTPRQPLNHPATRARFNAWMASGWFDVYREHNPSGGYYTAWRRSADGHLRAQNIGARTTMAFANQTLRERVTRSWHLDRYTRAHHCPIMLYVRPYGDPHGSPKPIVILQQPTINPEPLAPTGTLPSSYIRELTEIVSIQVYINLALPPYEPNAPTYQWYKDGQLLPDQPRYRNTFQRGYEFGNLLIDWVIPEDSGEYTCVIQNSTNSVTSEPVFLLVANDSNFPPDDPWGGYPGDTPPDGEPNPYTDLT